MDDARSTDRVRVVGAADLVDGDPTPGMRRQLAFAAPGLWAGLVHTEPGAASGWHHHGEHQTSLFVVTGVMRLESGPRGEQVAEAGPGEFLHVPAGVVHRESNPGAVRSTAVIARSGHGAPTVNVEDPGSPAPAPDPDPAGVAPPVARRYRALAVRPVDGDAGYVEHDRTADLSVGTYALPEGGADGQSPHNEDEVYVVVSGSATLRTPDVDLPAHLGDVLVVPAGVEHRFVGIGPDFRVVVVFGPAEGSTAR